MKRIKNALILTLVISVAVSMFSFSTAIAEVSPAVVDSTLKLGESMEVKKTATTPSIPSVLDVCLLEDETGSFNDDIAHLQGGTTASDIFDAVTTASPGANFAVAGFRDYPTPPYGTVGDYVYRLLSPMSPVKADWLAGIGALTAGGGNDTPEAQFDAIVASIDPLRGCGWRDKSATPGVQRVLVVTTDAPFHVPGGTKPHVNDLASTIAALNSAGVTVVGLKAPGSGLELDDLANATGGSVQPLSSDGSNIASAIVAGIEAVVTDVWFEVTYIDAGLNVSLTPAVHHGVAGGSSVNFVETIKVDNDPALSGKVLQAEVTFFANHYPEAGAVIGVERIAIKVPPQCSDDIDNDGDGLIDGRDPGCWTNPDDSSTYDPMDNSENQKPVITVIGDNPLYLTVGDVFVDPGAKADDPEDGDITGSILSASNVDTTTPGFYAVRYNVSDSQGLAADEAIRKVIVEEDENQKPVITLLGDNPYVLTVGDVFVDPGAKAEDPEDGDITPDIVVGGSVDTTVPGVYVLTYNVSDSQGLPADEVIRKVVVEEVVVVYAPYCGNGVVDQAWEQCDGSADCTEQCQIKSDGCSEDVFARVTVTSVNNWVDGDMTSDVFLGSTTNRIPSGVWFPVYYGGVYYTDAEVEGYENVPGLAVQRVEGSVRSRIYGSHTGAGKEHVGGTVEFFNNTAVSVADDIVGNNRLENGFDGIISYDNAGQDEVWIDGVVANFVMNVTTADDSFYANYGEMPECYGPYCGNGVVDQAWEQCDGGPNCTPQCQFASDECSENVFARVLVRDVNNWENGDMTSDIFLGGNGLVNRIPSGTWFPVYYDGAYYNDAEINGYEDVPGLAVQRLKGYIRTRIHGSHPALGGSKEHVSGVVEFFNNKAQSLRNDIVDNNRLENGFDGIRSNDNPNQDEVWINNKKAHFMMTVTTADDSFFTRYGKMPVCYAPYCGNKVVDQAWEQCDGGWNCTPQCQLRKNVNRKDIFARVNINAVRNWKDGNMNKAVYLGSATNKIPSGAWFPVYYGGVHYTDPGINGYEDVPGLAVQRLTDSIRTRIYGSHTAASGSKEHVGGTVQFFNSSAKSVSNDAVGNNALENGFDGIKSRTNPNQDEAWITFRKSHFFMTVTTADDSFFTKF